MTADTPAALIARLEAAGARKPHHAIGRGRFSAGRG